MAKTLKFSTPRLDETLNSVTFRVIELMISEFKKIRIRLKNISVGI